MPAMKQTTSPRPKSHVSRNGSQAIDRLESAASEMMNYAVRYARQNPGRAAIFCLGLGFMLGWKLKF